MPNVGDELHHFGWNCCSSACHGPDRSHLIVPGFRSSRVHIVNVADDPRRPRIDKVIEPDELVRKTGLTRPHTVHCMPGDNIVISMLGDADGDGACGFAVLDARTFEVKGRWENDGPGRVTPRPEVEAGGDGGAALGVAQRLAGSPALAWHSSGAKARDPGPTDTVPLGATLEPGHHDYGGSRGVFGSSGRTTP